MSTVQDRDVRHFYEHSGYSYNPATESAEVGLIRGAVDLAFAEMHARENGWEVSWEDDWEVDHQKEYDCYEDGDPTTCEVAILRDEHGTVLASLGCIDGATDEYRRVVEAELAYEAMSR